MCQQAPSMSGSSAVTPLSLLPASLECLQLPTYVPRSVQANVQGHLTATAWDPFELRLLRLLICLQCSHLCTYLWVMLSALVRSLTKKQTSERNRRQQCSCAPGAKRQSRAGQSLEHASRPSVAAIDTGAQQPTRCLRGLLLGALA